MDYTQITEKYNWYLLNHERLVCECFWVLTMMTDTPAVVLLCLGAVLKCVFSLPVTSIFMLFPMTASSYIHTNVQWDEVARWFFHPRNFRYESQIQKKVLLQLRCKYRNEQRCEIPWPKGGRGCLVLCIEPQHWPSASFQSVPATESTTG